MKRGVSCIIENYDGSYLLHLRDNNATVLKNQWCLVGGAIEDGENPIQALIREVKEETALDITNLSYIQNLTFNDKDIYVYHGRVDTRHQEAILGEGEELRFFNSLELLKLFKELSYTNPYLEAMMLFIRK